jgi:hypothetical protein
MSDDGGGFAMIDPNRSVALDSVGGAGWTVVVAVDHNGDEHWGVVDRAGYGNPTIGFTRDTPEHENLGPLNAATQRRITE